MEASACGLPIVATNIRGCRQVVEDGTTGILVPPRDPIALGAALERLIRDAGLRASMGAAARSRAAAEFDQQRVIDITLATYARLLGRSRS
jgi:glycosyltransferase involved in cell wall biosynthesis